jgi:hypothetical protein
MGAFRRVMGLDFVDTALHVMTTLFVAYLGAEVFTPGAVDDGAALATIFGASAAFYGWRRHRAMQNRPPESTAGVAAYAAGDLESRIAELEQAQGHMQELEERLDFAERLLTRDAAARHLPGAEA